MRAARRTLLIGIGNEMRGDDAVGVEVVRSVAAHVASPRVLVREQEDPVGLIDLLEDREAAVIVDAMRSGASPGTVRRLRIGSDPLPPELRLHSSTHLLTVAEALALARTLRRLPAQLVLCAVEGHRFEVGTGMSRELRAAMPALTELVLTELARARRS